MKLVDVLFMIDAAFILGAILSFFLIGSGVVRVTIFRKDGREVTPRQELFWTFLYALVWPAALYEGWKNRNEPDDEDDP